ncbi:GNAT family N-acetyltransferase [Streptomyces sp. BI20]|uniref:GNAT family N-acetyltransferase n=1 Tax=Streptomyces sp. BI20 TaxID=3403460 RepID=UPI003C73127E
MPDAQQPLVLGPLDLSEPATLTAAHRLGRASYAVEAELIGFPDLPALRESEAELRARELTWLGARTPDGALAGFLAWEETAVDRLCVDPALFRRGVASRLLTAFLAHPGRPAGPLSLTTGAANAPAVALYTRFGFPRGADLSPAPGLTLAAFTVPAR